VFIFLHPDAEEAVVEFSANGSVEKVTQIFPASTRTIEYSIPTTDFIYENYCASCIYHDEDARFSLDLDRDEEDEEDEEYDVDGEYCDADDPVGYVLDHECQAGIDSSIFKETKKLSLEVPSLILQWENYRYYLYYFEEEEGKLKCYPYRLGNIYDDGHICWGDLDSKKGDIHLLSAWEDFWNSVFNDDLKPVGANAYESFFETFEENYTSYGRERAVVWQPADTASLLTSHALCLDGKLFPVKQTGADLFIQVGNNFIEAIESVNEKEKAVREATSRLRGLYYYW